MLKNIVRASFAVVGVLVLFGITLFGCGERPQPKVVPSYDLPPVEVEDHSADKAEIAALLRQIEREREAYKRLDADFGEAQSFFETERRAFRRSLAEVKEDLSVSKAREEGSREMLDDANRKLADALDSVTRRDNTITQLSRRINRMRLSNDRLYDQRDMWAKVAVMATVANIIRCVR